MNDPSIIIKEPDVEPQGVDKYFKRYIRLNVMRELLHTVRVPSAKHVIQKEEGMYTYDSPDSLTGLYISLTSFIGFSEKYVHEYMIRSGNRVFLHIKREKIPQLRPRIPKDHKTVALESSALYKIKQIAEQVENGQILIHSEPEYKTYYTIVILPDKNVRLTYPDCELQHIVAESVEEIVRREAITIKIMKNTAIGTWPRVVDAIITRYSEKLVQLENSENVKPVDLKCAICDTVDNLWMNLSDGAIHCSKMPNVDNEQLENDHAYQHFVAHNYPLIIRVNTINTCLPPIVYSFPEGMLVKDANLRMHLRRFGITLLPTHTGPRSPQQQLMEIHDRFDEWYMLTEIYNEEQEILSGPGFTGMRNLGRTCYLNATLQLIFVIKDFLKRYSGPGANLIFRKYVSDPLFDFNLQLAKIGQGLTCGRYGPEGISPSIFKHLVCDNHPELKNPTQQDAYIFYKVFIDLVNNASRSSASNPVSALRICFEDCNTPANDNVEVKTKYDHYDEYCIQLPIPVTETVGCNDQLSMPINFNKEDLLGRRNSIKNLIQQKVPLRACIEAFFNEQIVEKYKFDDSDEPTTALRTRRMCNMPDYVMIRLCKFVTHDDWTPKKLDVIIDMPSKLDLNEWRSTSGHNVVEETPFTYNEALLHKLHMLGFHREASKRACFYTLNYGLEAACTWLKMHENDMDLEKAFELPSNTVALHSNKENDLQILGVLIRMGFSRYYAQLAMYETDGTIEQATKWLLSHSQTTYRSTIAEAPNEVDSLRLSNSSKYRDGIGTYDLVGFISHMGSSAEVGHYVCHVRKNNEWVLFDDLRVVKSLNPPKNLGYLYLYVRSQ